MPLSHGCNHFSHGIPGQVVAVMALHLYTFGTFIKPHHIAIVFLCIGTETGITRYSFMLWVHSHVLLCFVLVSRQVMCTSPLNSTRRTVGPTGYN